MHLAQVELASLRDHVRRVIIIINIIGYAPKIGFALMLTTCSKALSRRSESLAFGGSGWGSEFFTGIVFGPVKAAAYSLCCDILLSVCRHA